MKPSQKIIERAIDRLKPYHLKVSILDIEILNYLDEQYEQNKPCEHKNLETRLPQTGDVRIYDICKDCHAIGIFG